MFVGLVWLTGDHMLGSGNFGMNHPRDFRQFLKLPSFSSGNSKIFKNSLDQFIPNCPLKHMVTNTKRIEANELTPVTPEIIRKFLNQRNRKCYFIFEIILFSGKLQHSLNSDFFLRLFPTQSSFSKLTLFLGVFYVLYY